LQIDDPLALAGLSLAAACVLLAAVAAVVRHNGAAEASWVEVLAPAWAETAALAMVPALALAALSLTSPLHLATGALLAATALLLVPLLGLTAPVQAATVACCSLWLAGIWLAASCVNRWPILFAGFQAALALAVLAGIAAWLPGRELTLDNLSNLQVYGIGL